MKLFYNLHIHSCLSPCASDDMTPCNLVNMCALCGYDVIALTDHNSSANCQAAADAAREAGLLFIPGMELTTAEEVHVLCLFAELDKALAFSDYVYSKLPDVDNKPAIFGNQLLTGPGDEPRGTVDRLLSNASSVGVYEAAGLAAEYGGIALPAHIDRPSFSLLANLGFYDESIGFKLAELSFRAPEDFKSPLPYIINSDAHDLSMIPDAAHTLEILEKTPQAVIDALAAI